MSGTTQDALACHFINDQKVISVPDQRETEPPKTKEEPEPKRVNETENGSEPWERVKKETEDISPDENQDVLTHGPQQVIKIEMEDTSQDVLNQHPDTLMVTVSGSPGIKEEPEELDAKQVEEVNSRSEPQQVVKKETDDNDVDGNQDLKEEIDPWMITTTHDEKDRREPEPNVNQALHQDFPKPEHRQEMRSHHDSPGSSRNKQTFETEKQKKCKHGEVCGNLPVHMRTHTDDSCKSRWKTLRDTFVRYNDKQKSMPSGSGAMSHKHWKYSDMMFFLLPYIQPQSSKSNLETSAATQSSPPSPATSPAPEEERSGPFTSVQQTIAQGKRAQKRATPTPSIGEQLLQILDEPVPKQSKLPESDFDESYHFAMSIVPVLNRMDRVTRRDAKLAILSTLRAFEDKAQQHIHQLTPGPSTPMPHSLPPSHSQHGSSIQEPNPPPQPSTFMHMLDPEMSQNWY